MPPTNHAGSLGAAFAGATAFVVGHASQEQVARWVGIGLLVWSGVLAGYDRWRAARRANDRLDLEARLAELRSEIAAAESELSRARTHGDPIRREEGR